MEDLFYQVLLVDLVLGVNFFFLFFTVCAQKQEHRNYTGIPESIQSVLYAG